MFKQAPAFMCVVREPSHVFEMVNDRYLQLIGNREVIGKPVAEALPEVVEQGFVAMLDRVHSTGEPYVGTDVRIVFRQTPTGPLDERFLDFVYLPLRGADGAVTGILVHGVDLTERKRAEQALRASELRYRSLFDTMDEGFCVIEMVVDGAGTPVDWRYLEANPAFVKQTGLVDAVGRTAREVMPKIEDRWLQAYGRVAETGQSLQIVAESGDLGAWFEVSATRVGEPAERRVAVLFSDITARRRAEDKLRRLVADLADADGRKNEFLATLAHELRNPMAPLRTGLRLLRHPKREAELDARTIDMMERQLGHMVHLVDDLLDVARITGGTLDLRKERTDLGAVIGSAVECSMPLIEARHDDLSVDLADPALQLEVDSTRVAQVLGNLLDNAAKFSPAGGRIRLSARREGAEVVISVGDNGVGIAAESMPRIFEMFTKGSENAQGGLGIGLSIARRLIEMHGGTIEAESGGLGSGATFTVRLPIGIEGGIDAGTARDVGNPGAPGAGLAEAASTQPLRLLVVDDNVDAAESLSTLLGLSGHSVRVATDGVDALRQAAEFAPQVAFLDIGMPGMSGYEVAQALRRTPHGERLVMAAVTGWGTDEDKARARDAGFDHHLTKPVELAAVERILRSVSAGASAVLASGS